MKRLCMPLLTGSVLVIAGLTSCAQMPTSADIAESGAPQAVPGNGSLSAAPSEDASPTSSSPGDAEATAAPQLVKKAFLSLSVASVDESFEQVRKIMAAQQGDVLSMQDEGDRQRHISFQLRVPSERLDNTIDALSDLGTIRSRSVNTEDVSSQLIDLQARLNNARQSEIALQEIMARSGEISDVLEVSRELSNVRQNIEQMAARQKSLHTQVSFSTISLDLQSAIALSPNRPAVSQQLATAWEAATNSVGGFTTHLLKLGLWLLAYSPYLALLLCGTVLTRKALHRQARDGNS